VHLRDDPPGAAHDRDLCGCLPQNHETGAGGPNQAEIPQARLVLRRRTLGRGLEGRSRMFEVEAA